MAKGYNAHESSMDGNSDSAGDYSTDDRKLFDKSVNQMDDSKKQKHITRSKLDFNFETTRKTSS